MSHGGATDHATASTGSDFRGPRLAHPYVMGSLVGAIGATVFVLTNRGELPGPWPTVALVAWVAAAAAYIWAVWVRSPRLLPAPLQPRPRAGLIYGGSVLAMLVLFAIGGRVLADLDRAALMPALIVVGVALHFLPFAHAFRTPLFTVLGWTMTAIGLVGLVLGWTVDEVAAPASAVIAGVVMLVTISRGALSPAAGD